MVPPSAATVYYAGILVFVVVRLTLSPYVCVVPCLLLQRKVFLRALVRCCPSAARQNAYRVPAAC